MGSPNISAYKQGKKVLKKFGGNLNIGATQESIWCVGGDYPFPSSAEQLKIVSDDADDAVAGTGARQIILEGLDENYNECRHEIELNGLTAVTTNASFLRINRAFVSTAGSSGKQAGNIIVKSNDEVTTLAQIPIQGNDGVGQTTQAVYTVPAGKTFHFCYMSVSEFSNKQICFFLAIRPQGYAWRSTQIIPVKGSSHNQGDETLSQPLYSFPGKTDIKVQGYAEGGSGKGSATFVGFLE